MAQVTFLLSSDEKAELLAFVKALAKDAQTATNAMAAGGLLQAVGKRDTVDLRELAMAVKIAAGEGLHLDRARAVARLVNAPLKDWGLATQALKEAGPPG